MADQDIFGAIEDGTYSTTSPNPHVNLAGTSPSTAYIRRLFSAATTNGKTLTVTIRKDADNWACYKKATFTTGSPNIIDLSTGTSVGSAGSIANGEAVEVSALMPNLLPDPSAATQGAGLAVDANGDYELFGE